MNAIYRVNVLFVFLFSSEAHVTNHPCSSALLFYRVSAAVAGLLYSHHFRKNHPHLFLSVLAVHLVMPLHRRIIA